MYTKAYKRVAFDLNYDMILYLLYEIYKQNMTRIILNFNLYSL